MATAAGYFPFFSSIFGTLAILATIPIAVFRIMAPPSQKTKPMRLIARTVLIAPIVFSGACSFEEVKPWQRDVLAQDRAQLIQDRLEVESDQHIYFSKEAASGGGSLGGGGCGCN